MSGRDDYRRVAVGDDVIIGAGSVVVNGIPDNCVAIGNPWRIKL